MRGFKADAHGMAQIGRATPGSPAGDVWVSEALLAQEGEAAARELVRRLYEGAYKAKAREK